MFFEFLCLNCGKGTNHTFCSEKCEEKFDPDMPEIRCEGDKSCKSYPTTGGGLSSYLCEYHHKVFMDEGK